MVALLGVSRVAPSCVGMNRPGWQDCLFSVIPGLGARLSGSFLLYKLRGLDSTWSDAFSDASDMSRSRAVPHQNTVFRQLANRLPWAALERAIGEHRADWGVR